MKKTCRLLLIFSAIIVTAASTRAQQGPTDSLSSQWVRCEQLTRSGQPREAIALLDTLTTLARKEQKRDYLIKAAFFRLLLEKQTTDEPPTYYIAYTDSLISTAQNPVEKSILTVLKAREFIALYEQNRYQVNGRTAIQGGAADESKIDSWTKADYAQKIHALYTAALAPETLLKNTPNKQYEALLAPKMQSILRPTVFDLLVWDAMDFYLTSPLDADTEIPYRLSDSYLLASASDFAGHPFASPDKSDSLNGDWLMVGYYQKLLQFHIKEQQNNSQKNDVQKAALADLDMLRLEWAYDNSSDELTSLKGGDKRADLTKKVLYQDALTQAMKAYKGTDAALYGGFLLASTYSISAETYQASKGLGMASRYDYLKALEVINGFQDQLDAAVKKAANTKNKNKLPRGAASLLNLQKRITGHSLNMQLDAYHEPGKPILALVEYSNLTNLYFRILPEATRMDNVTFTDSVWQALIVRKPLQSFSQKLPETGDYQQHSVEMKIPALKRGTYILLASTDPHFSKDSILGAATLSVTNLAFITHGGEQFFVNRTSGKPLSGVKAKLYERRWENAHIVFKLDKTLIADHQGMVSYGDYYLNQVMMATYQGDTITSNINIYKPYSNQDSDDTLAEGNKEMLFYLDRAIYRPGQQVQFKGIATINYPDQRGKKLLTDHQPYKIYLLGAGQVIDSVTLPLNEFGSLSGVFKLPEGYKPGGYQLTAENIDGRAYFKVEDYKRPTYFVTLDTLKAAVALGDSITLHGQAMAYSGYPITDATIAIGVKRQVYFPYRWYGYLPPASNSAIAHGTVKTDDKGNFQFTFLASAGGKEELRFMPNYTYRIAASCTDQNGETRTANSELTLGTQPFNISLNIAEQSPDDLLDTILLQTNTASGRFTPQKVTLSIIPIRPPKRLLRTKNWNAPDLSVIDSLDFVRDFPHDAYMHEAEKQYWEKEAAVLTQQVTTNPAGKIALHQDLKPGWYLVEASAPGENGQVIRDQKYVYLYNPKSPDISTFYNWVENGNTSVLAGETTGLTLGSAVKNQPVIYSVTRMGKKGQELKYAQLVLNGGTTRLPLTLTKADIYGAQIDYSFVRDNRQYTGTMTASLKDTTTRPKIVYESYRDKTLPGSMEHWTLHIDKGAERLKNMELLSGMYDASLDQFAPNYWSIPSMKGGGQLVTSDWGNKTAFAMGSMSIHHPLSLQYTFDSRDDHLIFRDWLTNNVRMRGVIMLRGGQLTGRAAGIAAPAALNDVVTVGYAKEEKKVQALTASVTIVTKPDNTPKPVRTDFRETAFFFPAVHSDADGNYTIDFQMPDALTSWKWMNLAYDKDLNMVSSTQKVITQKTLMVSPNMPRFVRNGDHLSLSAKVINLSQQDLPSTVSIQLQDPATGKALHWLASKSRDKDGAAQAERASKTISVKANSNIAVRFDLIVPEDFTGPVDITIKAEGGQYSDAQKDVLPVITNKILVTETQPIYMDGDGKASFTMDKLLALAGNKDNSQKENKKLVFELTTSPIWNVVMALPEVQPGKNPGGMEVIYQLYAEAMGNYIMHKYPVISRVIQTWSNDIGKDTAENKNALLSALEKNPDLKSVLLQQTPWVMEAQNETRQHQALVRFFDKDKMDSMQRALVSKLLGLQQPDGGFSWFSGGRSDVLSTQWILSGINQLTMGKLKDESLAVPLADIAQNATQYLNSYYQMRYEQWQQRIKADSIKLRDNKADLSKLDTTYPIGAMEIHYLYTLSLNGDPGNLNTMQQHFLQAEKINWQQKSIYLQLMIAATQYRMADNNFAVNTVLHAVLDKSILKAGIGRYWKDGADYYNWASSPLPAQALAISLLTEVGKGGEGFSAHPKWQDYLSELQRYLIGQKQVNHWSATRATIDACVAIIDATPVELSAERKVEVQIGHLKPDLKQEVGTGYMRYEIAGKDITPDMGKVTLQLKGAGKDSPVPVYGGLYWQYISPIKAVEAAEKTTGITLEKALYKEVNTTSGKQLVAVKSTDILRVGDKLVSRLVIHVDRDMDYLHLREMRPAGVQPDQNISGYVYQDGLSFYQAISDMTTDMYFDHVNKGAYVIEYAVHVSHAGSFAAGTASMESFYAPSFATHTEGVSIQASQAN